MTSLAERTAIQTADVMNAIDAYIAEKINSIPTAPPTNSPSPGAQIDLFANIGTLVIPPSVTVIGTDGYAVPGRGMATYVNDAIATAALATSYPNICKKSADGRYWRLVDPYINVHAVGARGDNATDDQPAIQQAINYTTTILKGGTIYFPVGRYFVKETLVVSRAIGVNFLGEGQDVSIIKASGDGKPAMRTAGLWRSRFEQLGFWCDGNTSGAAFEYDGQPDGSFGCQQNTFISCHFFGNYNSKYTFSICRNSLGYGQCDLSTWISCIFAGTAKAKDTAAVVVWGTNALQNTLIGCNFQAFITGVLYATGALDILHCGFQSTYGYDQIKFDGWDVKSIGGSMGDTITMTGCRTESLRVMKGDGYPAHVSNFCVAPAALWRWPREYNAPLEQICCGWTASGNKKAYICTTAGKTGTTEPVWPESGTVTDGTAVWTYLDYFAFENIRGTLSTGSISCGRVKCQTNHTFIENVFFERRDAILQTYYDTGYGPTLLNCRVILNGDSSQVAPLDVNLLKQWGTYPEAGNTDPNGFYIGNKSLVITPHKPVTGDPGWDLVIGPDPVGINTNYKVENFWGVKGGWGFYSVKFSELRAIARPGVVYFVTDGTPGSSPLTGSGTGCLAVYQNSAWKAIS